MIFARKSPAPPAALTLVPSHEARGAWEYPRDSLGPAIHAARLVRWLQDHSLAGAIEAHELERQHYPAMCHELRWQPENWTAVGREIRRLLGLPKRQTRYRRGGYRIVYIIPPPELPKFDLPRV